MNNPKNFILTTDYATSKQDDFRRATVVMPGSVTVPANGYVSRHVDLNIGSRGSVIRSRIATSFGGNQYFAGSSLSSALRYSNPYFYGSFGFVIRINATTIRCMAIIPNPYSISFVTAPGDETFNFEVATLLPPIS